MAKKFKRDMLGVYFIMGSNNCTVDPRVVLKEAIEGGITLFQFREKGEGALTGKEKDQLAYDLQVICQTHKVPFIVNDDIDLAVKLNADGVHIGQEDDPVDVVRQKIGEDKILGVSAHTVEEAVKAIESGTDYLGIGPIFPTHTKPDAKEVKGVTLIETLRAQNFDIPIVGIGGITPNNATIVMQGGGDGVSVITAISQAESPKEAALALKKAIKI